MREPVKTPTEQRDPPPQLHGHAAQLPGHLAGSVRAREALRALARLLARQTAADAMRSNPIMSSKTKAGTTP